MDSLRAITAAVAHQRERELALALFHRNFVTGEGLRSSDVIRSCWAEAGLDPTAYDVELERAKPGLIEATNGAIADGVPGVSTVTVAGVHFWGDDRLADAAAAAAAL